jgi:ribosome-associated protein
VRGLPRVTSDSTRSGTIRGVRANPIREVQVRDDGIRLGQLLKLAGLVDAGSDVKPLLEQGLVTVGGRTETRRGRQLNKGDVVAVGGEKVRLV